MKRFWVLMLALALGCEGETWLQQALDILAENPEHLRIDGLAERLGVRFA